MVWWFYRNPDMEGQGPWCYTTDPDVRFTFCNVTTCSGKNVKKLIIRCYAGVADITIALIRILFQCSQTVQIRAPVNVSLRIIHVQSRGLTMHQNIPAVNNCMKYLAVCCSIIYMYSISLLSDKCQWCRICR